MPLIKEINQSSSKPFWGRNFDSQLVRKILGVWKFKCCWGKFMLLADCRHQIRAYLLIFVVVSKKFQSEKRDKFTARKLLPVTGWQTGLTNWDCALVTGYAIFQQDFHWQPAALQCQEELKMGFSPRSSSLGCVPHHGDVSPS